jgi:hypothetical protein
MWVAARSALKFIESSAAERAWPLLHANAYAVAPARASRVTTMVRTR